MRQKSPPRAFRMADRSMLYFVVVATIMTTRQSVQTMAFSPSSLKPKSLTHATKNDWRERDDLKQRTTRVSNFALSASSAAAASSVSTIASSASSNVPPMISVSNLAVSLDRPLLSPVEYTYRTPASKSFWSKFLTVLLSDVCKTALVAFLLAVGFTLVPKLISSINGKKGSGEGGSITTAISDLASRILAPIQNLLPDSLKPSSSTQQKKKKKKQHEAYSAPMPFEGDGGWGKCTLRSKKSVGTFEIYEFALPESYYTVPLALGQQLEFCCLSASDDICTGSFYPYNDAGDDDTGEGGGSKSAGCVRVVLPNDREADEGSVKFMQVLRDELRPGEEVAIKPGKSHLTYNGKHVPVTDMVYLASGLGIVPIIDQIKAITPRGSSSVKVSSVVWMNDNRLDFDLAMDDLEAEYMRHPTKLAVSCIMDDATKNPLEGNKEVEEAVPYFNAGTMAVVAGPKRFAEKARGYLMRKGYPDDCICVLP